MHQPYSPAGVVLDENHVGLGTEGTTMDPVSCRLIWPSQMDLMAQLAGLRLVERPGGWIGEQFEKLLHARVAAGLPEAPPARVDRASWMMGRYWTTSAPR